MNVGDKVKVTCDEHLANDTPLLGTITAIDHSQTPYTGPYLVRADAGQVFGNHDWHGGWFRERQLKNA